MTSLGPVRSRGMHGSSSKPRNWDLYTSAMSSASHSRVTTVRGGFLAISASAAFPVNS